jgi:hypothetical protein
MATKNPRISVMLNPSSDAILRRLSDLTGQSKSSIVAEFLEDTCMPMFQRMIPVLEAAATASEEAKAATKQSFVEAENRLMEVLGVTEDLFDTVSKPLLDDAEKIRRRAPKVRDGGDALVAPSRPAPEVLPPHVTRGSGTPNKGKSKAKTTMKTGSNEVLIKKASKNQLKQASEPFKRKVKG